MVTEESILQQLSHLAETLIVRRVTGCMTLAAASGERRAMRGRSATAADFRHG